jgi:hypothetical protein
VFWGSIPIELADVPSVTPLLKPPAKLPHRWYSLETHQQQSQKHRTHWITRPSPAGVRSIDLANQQQAHFNAKQPAQKRAQCFSRFVKALCKVLPKTKKENRSETSKRTNTSNNVSIDRRIFPSNS